MSIFLPYNVEFVIQYFTSLYSIDLSTLTSYESLIITLIANLYFFIYWGIIIYFVLKLFNRVWERFF